MLTTFPSLLMYGFFVPAIFRFAVAASLAYLAVQHFTHKKAVAGEIDKKFAWLSHETAVWLTGLLILAELGAAVLLFVGAWTQIAAILAGLGMLKMWYFARSMPAYAPLSRLAYVLLAVMCLSLLLTGAGAFAFDLPL